MKTSPVVSSLVAGILVAVALLLLAGEHFRDKSAGGGAQSYYSQF